MRNWICTLGMLLSLAVAPCAAFADKADTLIKEEMQKHQVAGIALVVSKDGHPIKTKGYGVASLELNVPVTKDTVFEIDANLIVPKHGYGLIAVRRFL